MKRFLFPLITTCEFAVANKFKTFAAMIGVVFLILAMAQSATHAQEPPQYQLNWVQNIWGAPGDHRIYGRHINESGVVVGNTISQINGERSAFRFFENQNGIWITEDINQLGGLWIDLDGSETTVGWTANTAVGINVWGHIVGTASHGTYENRAYILRFPAGLPEFTLLPRSGNQANQGIAINDDDVAVASGGPGGTIVFTPWTTIPYEPVELLVDTMSAVINNSGVIVVHTGSYNDPIASRVRPVPNGGAYDYGGATIDTFPGRNFTGVNDYGNICGMRQSEGRGRNRIHGGAIRIDVDEFGDVFDEVLLASGDPPFELLSGGINNADDVCYSRNGTPFVDMTAHGPFDLDQLVVNPDNDWLNSDIEPWGINNSGLICGQTSSALKTFVLTPVVAGPGISVSPVAGLTTTEAGGSDSFTIVLDTQPIDNVTIGISTSDETEGLIDDPVLGLVVTTSLTFTPGNWNVTQTVTVKGVEDFEIDGTVTYMIVTSADTNTTDPDYNGLNPADVTVTNLDNEQPPSVPYYSTGGENNVPIHDQSTAISSILVTDNFTITDLNVTLNIDHERVQDLDVFLISDDGTRIELFTDVGGSGQDFTNTTLDDEAATSITVGSAPFTGSFRPEGILGGFDGKSTNGLWTLEVTDDKRRKTGTILNWSFTVEY